MFYIAHFLKQLNVLSTGALIQYNTIHYNNIQCIHNTITQYFSNNVHSTV